MAKLEHPDNEWSAKDLYDTIEHINKMLKYAFDDGKETANTVSNKIEEDQLRPAEETIILIEGIEIAHIQSSFDHTANTILERSYTQSVIKKMMFQQPNTGGQSMTPEEQLRWFRTKAKSDYYRKLHSIGYSINHLLELEQKGVVSNTNLIWIDPPNSSKKPTSVEDAYRQETSGNGNLFYYPSGELTTIIGIVNRSALLNLFGFTLDEDMLVKQENIYKFVTKKTNHGYLVKKAYQSPKNPNIFTIVSTEQASETSTELITVNEEIVTMRPTTLEKWIHQK